MSAVTKEQLLKAAELLEKEERRRIVENALANYKPYARQLEFHNAGATFRERLLMAGNQVGKTLAAAMEFAAHATGLYPEWWQGYRFDRPILGWACGETSEVVRDTIQKRFLLGDHDTVGAGCLPKAAILEVVPARGLAELADIIRVRHVSGGVSTISLKGYSQGRERFQGSTIDLLWLDEEPDVDIFTEALTRTNVRRGPMMMTFTPLRGTSTVVKRFVLEKSPHRTVVGMTLDDAAHYDDAKRAELVAQYPEHERDARIKGIPAMGSGRVFKIDEEKLLVDHFECPRHWVRLGGMDFGWTHYAAFCEIWWDRDLDVLYLVRTLRLREKTPLQHVEAVRHWNLRWAWPHDGRSATLAGAGVPLMQQYADGRLKMMHEHACFEDGSNSVEAGIQMMIDRMRGGRWKVFRGDNDGWLEEFRMFHRDGNGMLVKEGDDAISASRYGMMMLRHGRTVDGERSFSRKINYPSLGLA